MGRLTLNDSGSALLKELGNLPVPKGYGWKVWKSRHGRGWRLATTKSLQPSYPTPLEALRAYFDFAEE